MNGMRWQRIFTELGLVIGRIRLETDGHEEISYGQPGLTKSCSAAAAADDDDDDD